MTIISAIENAKQKISNIYDKINEKGGTIPTDKNLANVIDAIDSIPSGSGGETLVAINYTEHTVKSGDKVWINTKGGNYEFSSLSRQPKIDGSFIASDFPTSDDGLKSLTFTTTNNMELVIKIITGDNNSRFQNFFAAVVERPYEYLFEGYIENGKISFWVDKQLYCRENITANHTYYVRIKLINGMVYLASSEDGLNYNDEVSHTFNLVMNKNFVIRYGFGVASYRYWGGSIDLKETYIKIDGVEVWRGVKDLEPKQLVNYENGNIFSLTGKAQSTILNTELGNVSTII